MQILMNGQGWLRIPMIGNAVSIKALKEQDMTQYAPERSSVL